MAGLVCLHSNEDYYYLFISRDEEIGKCINILTANKGEYKFPIEKGISIEGWDKCYLQVRVEVENLQFYYSKDEENWTAIGPGLDAALLSNEYCRDSNFTGAFVGLCCQDLNGTSKAADFDYFEYIEL